MRIKKIEDLTRKKKGKREYLNNKLTKEMIKELNDFFESYLKLPRMKVGYKQTIEILIHEESLLFAKYLRNGVKIWTPRILAN